MQFGDEIGGHLVSGHIDCTATIDRVEDADNYKVFFTISNDEVSCFAPLW